MSGLGDLECGESLCGDGAGGTTIRNLGFETGAYGFAASWESGSATQFGTLAAFGLEAAETFEHGWANRPYAFTLPVVVAAEFSVAVYVTPPRFEDFERGWSNFPFFSSTFTAVTCIFTGALDAEGFEEGWDNDSYLYVFAGGLTAAVFNGDNFEDFESGWANDSYVLTWSGGTAMVISGVLAKTVENFEDVKDPQVYYVDSEAFALVTVAHGLSVNYRVVLDLPIGGTIPASLAPLIPYYVQTVVNADFFQVALLPSAPDPIACTLGSGLLRWRAPYEFWTTRMATL